TAKKRGRVGCSVAPIHASGASRSASSDAGSARQSDHSLIAFATASAGRPGRSGDEGGGKEAAAAATIFDVDAKSPAGAGITNGWSAAVAGAGTSASAAATA